MIEGSDLFSLLFEYLLNYKILIQQLKKFL